MPQACRIDAKGYVVTSDRKIHVSKGKHEDVLWIATQNGGPWKITFDKDKNGSPFSESCTTSGEERAAAARADPSALRVSITTMSGTRMARSRTIPT